MKLFSFGPDIEEAEEPAVEPNTTSSSEAKDGKSAAEEDIDAKRAKRREKKRKANAKKLAKKHLEQGTTPTTCSRGKNSSTDSHAVNGASKRAKKAGSSSESDSDEEEPAPISPTKTAPPTYFDPFTRRRVAIGGGSAVALGDSRAQAPIFSPGTEDSKPRKKADKPAGNQVSRAMKGTKVQEQPTAPKSSSTKLDSSSDDSSDNSSSDEKIAGTTPKGSVSSSTLGSSKGDIRQVVDEKPAVRNPAPKKARTKNSASSSSSSSDSSGSSDEEDAKPAAATPAAPKTYYDPFSKKRIVIGAGSAHSAQAEVSRVQTPADKQANDTRAKLEAGGGKKKQDASESRSGKLPTGAELVASTKKSSSSNSAQEESAQDRPAAKSKPLSARAKKAGKKKAVGSGSSASSTSCTSDASSDEEAAPTAAKPPAPQSYFDPFTKKRVVIAPSGGASQAEVAAPAPPAEIAAAGKREARAKGAKTATNLPSNARKGSVSSSSSSSSSSDGDDSSGDEASARVPQQGKAKGPQSYYDPFSKKRIAIGAPQATSPGGGGGCESPSGRSVHESKRQCLRSDDPPVEAAASRPGDAFGEGPLKKQRGGKPRPDLAKAAKLGEVDGRVADGGAAAAHGAPAAVTGEPLLKEVALEGGRWCTILVWLLP